MFLNVYNKEMEQVGVVDIFTSLIWTKRYNEPGDFEVVMPLDEKLPEYIMTDYYVSLNEDLEIGYYMIIETILIKQDPEEGLMATISGRSLESILDRRIAWDKLQYTSKKSEFIIKDLLEKSFINPKEQNRKIPNFIYKEPKEGFIVSDNLITIEYDGDVLLESIQSLCSINFGILNGFSVRYIDGNFIYQSYSGTNRSHNQSVVDEVLYSPNFDTLASSQYLRSTKNYKNVFQIVSEEKKIVAGEDSGLRRREKRETIQNTTNLNSMINIIKYQNMVKTVLEGETINDVYIYGRDVFVGDIVQFSTGYGIESRARMTEYIYSEDLSGINNYPTFSVDEFTNYIVDLPE